MATINRQEQLALVNAARAGDQGAFTALYSLMRPLLYRALYNMVPQDDLDDLMQDTMVRAFSKLDQFNEESSFSTWCTRIGINLGLMHIRGQKTEARFVAGSLDNTFTTDDGAEIQIEVGYDDRTFDQRTAYATIDRALGFLSKDQRTALEMKLDGYSLEDIRQVTGQTIPGVKAALHHARANVAAVVKGKRKKPVRHHRPRTPRKLAAA